jgi:hypothetical protein
MLVPDVEQTKTLFRRLDQYRTTKSFPAGGALRAELQQSLDAHKSLKIPIKPEVASLFASASVEMWLRSVHSYLVSVSLYRASPLWSSVAGYYSSHYAMRAYCHLFGVFRLFTLRATVQLELVGDKWTLSRMEFKGLGQSEHHFYWGLLKKDLAFASDPLFSDNLEQRPNTDSSHRAFANYIDHLNQFPEFSPVDTDFVRVRVARIADLLEGPVALPNRDRYPDLDVVHIVALARIIRFRKYLDDLVVDFSKFWKLHRQPAWCKNMIDFQANEPNTLPSRGVLGG